MLAADDGSGRRALPMLDQVFTAEPVPLTLDDDDIWNIH